MNNILNAILSCFFFCLSTASLFAQEWSVMPSYNGDSRHHPITFSNDTYGFVIAGQTGPGEYLEDVHRFDSQTNTWEQLANFPGGPRGFGYGVASGNKAYLGFGRNNEGYTNDWWEYDMQNDIWTQLADFPSAGRIHPALVIVNESVYMGLGGNSFGNLGDWWEYNIADDEWTQKADFEFGDRHHPFYFGIGDYPYVGFGHGNSLGNGYNIYNDFYKYDPFTDEWITMSELPAEGRVAGTQFSYNGKGYALSGDGDDHSTLDSGELWEYDPQNDSWLQLDSHPGNSRWAPGCFVINCNIYFTSGLDRQSGTYYNDMLMAQIGDACGCLDSNAINYNSSSTIQDNSCCYVSGCTDPSALNYDGEACYDDGSCVEVNIGCDNPMSSNYDAIANSLDGLGGPLDIYELGVGSYHFGNAYDMVFDCLEEVSLNSVDVYAQTDFSIQVEILDENDIQVFSNTFSLSTGLNTLSLDYEIEIGENYKIGIEGENFGLFRNNFVDSTIFPFDIADALSITANTTDSPQSYFYYFYNWNITASCDATFGCTDSLACNYQEFALNDDSSCVFPQLGYDCEGNCLFGDLDNDSICDCEDMQIIIEDCDCEGNDPNTFTVFYNDVDEDVCVLYEFCDCECYNDFDNDGICDENEKSWNCVDGACIDPLDGLGTYLSLEDCESSCQLPTSIGEFQTTKRLVKVTNLLGQEITPNKNIQMLYIYEDGTVLKRFIVD